MTRKKENIRLLSFASILLLLLLSSCQWLEDDGKEFKTTMVIEDPSRQYYPLQRGDTLYAQFKVFNTGSNALVIEDVQPSCGCVAIRGYKRVIAPADSSYINLEYHSAKNIGAVHQYVTIVANTKKEFTEIEFGTNVVPSADYVMDYEEFYYRYLAPASEKAVDGEAKLMYATPMRPERGLRE